MKRWVLCVPLALVALACGDSPTPTAVGTPTFAIQDGAHNGGNPHFYWLPPLVPAPSPTGTFDPSSSPVVRISEWNGGEGALVAEFTRSSGPGSETVQLDVQGQRYFVNWHSVLFDLNPNINYRIRVLVAGTELGFADVDVVSNNGDLRRVDPDHIPLRTGRDLLIPFRIEQGALGASLTLVKHVVNDNGRTAVAADFTLSAAGPTPISGAGGVSSGPGFLAGTYTLSETGPAGYTPSAWTCTGGTQAGSQITLAVGDSAVCQITNDDVPPSASLTLAKHVVNDNGRTAVVTDFTLTAAGPTPISGAGGVSSGPGFLPGTYTLSETGPAGYTPGAWTCTGGTQAGSQITLAQDDSAVCAITNDDAPPNFVRLQSDPGDFVGAGGNYEYTQANAIISVAASGGHLRVGIGGDEGWSGDFQVPNTLSRLEPGTYSGLTRYPFHNPAVGGLAWFGEGRGCNTLTGSFTIERVTYVNNALTAIDLSFEQHCEGGTPALRGTIHWDASDQTRPPDPVFPVPGGLWQPAPGSTPATGNFVYLNSDVGDFIGQGQTYTYTPETATITLSTNNQGHLSVAVSGAQGWNGDFQTMYTLSQLAPGYYPDLQRYPFHNPAKGGLSWTGEGRGCNRLLGWFAVDRVVYTNGVLTSLDLRFEQRCEGGTAALHGAIRWDR